MMHFKILNDQTVQVSKTLVRLAVRSVNTSPHKFQRSSYDYILPVSTIFVVIKLFPIPPEMSPNTRCILFKDHQMKLGTLPSQLRSTHNSHTLLLLITQKVKKVTNIMYSVTIFRMSFMKIIYLVFAKFTSVVESEDIRMNASITFGRFIWNPTNTIKRISVTRLFMK
jgi:hypothetical protein